MFQVNNWEREWVHGTVMTRAQWVLFNLLNGVVVRYSVGGIINWWYETNQESLHKNLKHDENGLIVFTGEP